MRIVFAIVGGWTGAISCGLIGPNVWPDASISAVFGLALASFLLGSALGAVVAGDK